MSKQYRPGVFTSANRDRNESKITEILRRYHVKYFRLSPGAGADILVKTSPMMLWEVKDGERKWTLTTAEKLEQSYCQEVGIPYHVVESSEQAAEILAAHFQKGKRNG